VNRPHRVNEQISVSCGGCREPGARRWSYWISSEGIPPRMFHHDSGEEILQAG